VGHAAVRAKRAPAGLGVEQIGSHPGQSVGMCVRRARQRDDRPVRVHEQNLDQALGGGAAGAGDESGMHRRDHLLRWPFLQGAPD